MSMRPAPYVLYLTYDGLSDSLGQSQILPYLVELAKSNFRIKILSVEKKEKSEVISRVKKITEEAGISWDWILFHTQPKGISTVWNYLLLRKKIKSAIAEETPSFIHCRSYLAALMAMEAKKQYGIPYLFDIRGFWIDERVESGLWNLRNPLYRLVYSWFRKKEKELFQHADHVITLTQASVPEICRKFGVAGNDSAITVIPCCADGAHFSKGRIQIEQIEQFRKRFSLNENDFILMYSGSWGTWYMTDAMLQFFKLLNKRIPNSKFLILSHDGDEKIKSSAQKLMLNPGSLRMAHLKRNEMPIAMSLATAAVFFIQPSYSKMASSPTKLAEFMCMGIPVICNSGVGDVAEVIQEAQAGILVQHISENGFEEAFAEWNRKSFSDSKIIEYAHRKMELQVAVAKYEKIYQRFFSGR